MGKKMLIENCNLKKKIKSMEIYRMDRDLIHKNKNSKKRVQLKRRYQSKVNNNKVPNKNKYKID